MLLEYKALSRPMVDIELFESEMRIILLFGKALTPTEQLSESFSLSL